MTSSPRIIANRANAQHSTGPRTSEGKAKAAGNARKHGVLAAQLSCDEQALVQAIAQMLCDDGLPGDSYSLARSMATLARVHRARSGIFNERRDAPSRDQLAFLERLERYERRALASVRRLLDASERRLSLTQSGRRRGP